MLPSMEIIDAGKILQWRISALWQLLLKNLWLTEPPFDRPHISANAVLSQDFEICTVQFIHTDGPKWQRAGGSLNVRKDGSVFWQHPLWDERFANWEIFSTESAALLILFTFWRRRWGELPASQPACFMTGFDFYQCCFCLKIT